MDIPKGGISMEFFKKLCIAFLTKKTIHTQDVGLLYEIFQRYGPKSWQDSKAMQTLKGILGLPSVLGSKDEEFYAKFRNFIEHNAFQALFSFYLFYKANSLLKSFHNLSEETYARI